jgi:hypothetical protein
MFSGAAIGNMYIFKNDFQSNATLNGNSPYGEGNLTDFTLEKNRSDQRHFTGILLIPSLLLED